MFIHWSFDVQLGMVISHSVVGASPDYLDRYFNELPKTFEPTNFQPEKWARMAKMAGMKYVVFTAKHHSGFCMYDTETTDFNVMNTPLAQMPPKRYWRPSGRRAWLQASIFRPMISGICMTINREIGRRKPGSMPSDQPDLIEYLKTQTRELMTQYAPIDIVFH